MADDLRCFAKKVLVATTVIAAVGLLLSFLKSALPVLLLVFAGILLSLLWRGAAGWLQKRTPLGERTAIGTVATIVAVLFGVMLYWFVPQLQEQIEGFRTTVPLSIQQSREWLSQRGWGLALLRSLPELDDLSTERFWGAVLQATGFAYTAIEVLFGFVVLIFVTLYLSVNPNLYIDGSIRLIPKRHRGRAAEVYGALAHTLRFWLVASLFKMAVVGVLTYIALRLLDVPLAGVLAVIAFLLDFVPYFGPIAAALPGILIAFTEGPDQMLWVAVAYFMVQQIEGFVISPILFHKTVYLPPVVTIVIQIVLGTLAGALGVILATPLAAGTLVLTKTIYVEDILGENMHVEKESIESRLVKQDKTAS